VEVILSELSYQYNKRSVRCTLVTGPFLFLSSSNTSLSAVVELSNACDNQFSIIFQVSSKSLHSNESIKPCVGKRGRSSSTLIHCSISQLKLHHEYLLTVTIFHGLKLYQKSTSLLFQSLSSGYDEYLIDDARNDKKDKFRVAFVGDTQANAPVFRSILSLLLEQTSESKNLDLFIHVGDSAQAASLDHRESHMYFASPLNDFLQAERVRDQKSSLIALVRGNHDSYHRYLDLFGSVSGRVGTYYATMIKNQLMLIVLDSNSPSIDIQRTWLFNLCMGIQREKRNVDWKKPILVFIHVPPFVEYWDPNAWTKNREHLESEIVRRDFLPILVDICQVNVVVSAHSHIYQRGRYKNTTMLIVGGGGGQLETEKVANWTSIYSVTLMQHHYCMLEGGGDRYMDLSCYNLNNQVLDKVRIE
jgi:predicted phosphodiesterase